MVYLMKDPKLIKEYKFHILNLLQRPHSPTTILRRIILDEI